MSPSSEVATADELIPPNLTGLVNMATFSLTPNFNIGLLILLTLTRG